jgi:tRNA(Ile)-lysidine synthase
MSSGAKPPHLRTDLFHPGTRIAVACSGGADSIALLRALLEQRNVLGLVLSVAHMNHGIRGGESDADERFVADLAASYDLPFHSRRADTPAIARASREGLEETARNLRYAWFRDLLTGGEADAVVTAHTVDDQAETVLHRLLRGAWTEGLGGIHPVLKPAPGQSGLILRPFLGTTRREIEAWLNAIGQPWREDSTNADTHFTRNRLRHELLPTLAEYNPAVKQQFAQLAVLARDEEAYWQTELARLLPSLLLPGRAVRGGGRATDTLGEDRSLSIEVERLRPLHPALRRRVLRAAGAQLGFAIDFDETERLLTMCGLGETTRPSLARRGVKLQMQKGLHAERTPRELRLKVSGPPSTDGEAAPPAYELAIPGAVDAPAFGLRLEATLGNPPQTRLPSATLRASRPEDRVMLRHSRSPMKIAEALKRAHVAGRAPVQAAQPPVLVWCGEIVWAPGLEVESEVSRALVLSVNFRPLA